MRVVDDLRGGVDGHGNRLEVTVRALADEAAAMADLVKGKLDGVPAAILRGLEAWVTPEDGPGAARLLRTGSQDWFRYGHVEAVRTSLGTSPGWPGVPAVPLPGGTAAERLQRALDVALASPHWPARAQAPDPWVLVAVEALPQEGHGDPDGPGDASEAGDVAQAVLVPHPEATAWELICLGALGQRVLALAWAEGLDAVVVERFHDPEPSVAIRAVIRPE
jgi:coenzyme F420-0:L-glutamate ligase/coenzyme F420-1:gamma-L-glutamate ligase